MVKPLSRDGKLLACCSFPDGALYIWDVAADKLLRRIRSKEDSWRLGGFSPDASGIRTLLGKDLRVLSTTTGKELRRFALPHEMVPAALAPDGKAVACMPAYLCSGEVMLFDTHKGIALSVMEGHGRAIKTLVFSPDGERLATASGESRVCIWDGRTGKLLKYIPADANGVAWSRDGRMIATTTLRGICLWDASTFALIRNFDPKPLAVGGGPLVFLSGDKHLVFSDTDGHIHLLDTKTRKVLAPSLQPEGESQKSIFFCPTGVPELIPYAVAKESDIIALRQSRTGPYFALGPKNEQETAANLCPRFSRRPLAQRPSNSSEYEGRRLPGQWSHRQAHFSPAGNVQQYRRRLFSGWQNVGHGIRIGWEGCPMGNGNGAAAVHTRRPRPTGPQHCFFPQRPPLGYRQ